MAENPGHINSDLNKKNNTKIKNEKSKKNNLNHSNEDKLIRNIRNKNSNYSPTDEKITSSFFPKKHLHNNNSSTHRNNQRQTSIKNNSSAKRRIKDKNNKEQLKGKDIGDKKRLIKKNIKTNQNEVKSPLTNSKMHKRINSLHLKDKENEKNIKTINVNDNSQHNSKLNTVNQNKQRENNLSKNMNTIEYNNKNQKINNNNINNIKAPNIPSSNDISFTSENKIFEKSEKKENNLDQKDNNLSKDKDNNESNDIYYSLNKDINNNIINKTEKEENKTNIINDIKVNNNTLSGKIASRAKNLNKIIEENFKSVKKETKENEIKSKDKVNELSDGINSNNISVNEMAYSTINSSGKINNNNHSIISRILNQNKAKPLSSDLDLKKKKEKNKSGNSNHSLELRNRHNIKDNTPLLENNKKELNNHNNERKNNPIKVFSKSDFRQINTSPFVKSKPPIRPKHTNCLPRKALYKNNENNNINLKSIDNKYNSPQKEVNHLKGLVSLNVQKKTNDNNSIFSKKKKVIAKRKNRSMIIEDKKNEKKKNNNDENNINSAKSKKSEENKSNTIDIHSSNNKSMDSKKPIRAQSQQEICIDSMLEEIIEKNINKNEENIFDIKRIEKVITKLQTLCKKGFAGPGVKKTNQDNFFIYNNFNNNSQYIYLGVCDGHGMFGQDVSGYLVNTLPQNMNANLLNGNISSLSTESNEKLFPIISSTFISTNIDMIEDERVDSSFSGSTCVTLFYTPSRLICANVGDSRCVLGKFDGKNWKSKNLSRDQKPSEQDEYERIINAGGRIESFKDENGNCIGPERVWLKEDDVPGLAMSRSFGDEVAHLVGVITDPEINEYFFSEEDKFIIIASDGLWEFISSDECILMVKEFYLKDDIDGALSYLYKESSKRWIMEEEVIDDITILMAFLN